MFLRPGTSDAVVFWETLVEKRHMPPDENTPIRRIWDLGSNIGLTVAHLAAVYPEARITGVELDEGTAGMARSNIVAYEDRCSIITGAVWFEDGAIEYEFLPNEEYGARVTTDPAASPVGASVIKAKSYSLNTLLGGENVDYMKMDIEGAEKEVLTRNTEWLELVRSIKVEVHGDYTTDQCERDLQAHGFATQVDTSFLPVNAVSGVRV